MANKKIKIQTKIYPNMDYYKWEFDYIPQKNDEVIIKNQLYTVVHKTFLYDEGILRMDLMRA